MGNTKKREGFRTTLGVITATLGSAVGLGNIWKFPYMVGDNGGAAFLLIYLISVVFVGLPVMISELLIGRHTKANVVRAFKKIEPQKKWHLVGVSGVITSIFLMAYYTTVVGWVFSYVFKAFFGIIHTTDPSFTNEVFTKFTAKTLEPLLWQIFVLFLAGTIIAKGVTKGIEKTTKILMPILFILLLLLGIRALTLPGAFKGLEFLFKPDFTKITGGAILAAMGLAFFKLSIGMGTMLTYGSYFGDSENIPATTFKVVLSDTFVSILAGIAIFPAVFAFGVKPDAGPSLLFITIPTVFSSMPFGNLIMGVFFVLVSISAIGAMLSMLEVPVAYLIEEKNFSRKKAAFFSIGIIGLLGSTATMSFGVLSHIQIFGKTFFEVFDFLTSNILMPIGGILICIFISKVWGYKNVLLEASNKGNLKISRFIKAYYFITKYIAPVTITVILLNGLGIFSI